MAICLGVENFGGSAMTNFEKIMQRVSKVDMEGEIWWNTDLEVFVKCSDLFYWGASDCEPLTVEDLPLFESSIVACEPIPNWGDALYCCRKRKERPQGIQYQIIDRELWPLFDECGPKKEVGVGNPYKHYRDMSEDELQNFLG